MSESPPTAADSNDPPPPAPAARVQFTLGDLLQLVTAAAFAALLVRWHGTGTLVASCGMTLAWFNMRGKFGWLQTRRARPRLFFAAWPLIAVSFFLPAVRGCGDTPMEGWRAAKHCAMDQVDIVVRQVSADKRQPTSDVLWGFSFLLLWNLANVTILLSPWMLWCWQKGHGHWLAGVLAISLTAVWLLPFDTSLIGTSAFFLIGYYVWCGGLTMLWITHRTSRKTLAAMAAVAGAFLFAIYW